MSKHPKSAGLTLSAFVLAGLMAGASSAAMAADGVSATQDQGMERATKAPHKVANQFHRRQVINETAEFARLEIAPEGAAETRRRPNNKMGNRFHKAN